MGLAEQAEAWIGVADDPAGKVRHLGEEVAGSALDAGVLASGCILDDLAVAVVALEDGGMVGRAHRLFIHAALVAVPAALDQAAASDDTMARSEWRGFSRGH